jgi:hypothetical protein
VDSSIRTTACGGAHPDFLRQASWRFLVDGGFAGISTWTVWLGPDRAFLAVPRGAGRLYCYADLDASSAIGPSGSDPAALAELCGRFADPVPAILAAQQATGQAAYFSPIDEVAHESWVHPFGNRDDHAEGITVFSPNGDPAQLLVVYDSPAASRLQESGGALTIFADLTAPLP